MRLLLSPEDVAVFYRSQTLSSYEALEQLGFEHTLGLLNTKHGAQLHSRLLRSGTSFGADVQERLCEATEAALRSYASGDRIELYRFCRELVVRFVTEIFAGPAVARLEGFAEQYLDFQLAHESAVAKAMVLGKMLTWYFLERARARRVALVRRIAPLLESVHAEQLGPDLDPLQRADLIVGLLTAATKNVAIGSATCLVYMLQHGAGPEQAAAAVAETLRLTCLSFGALRVVTRSAGEQFPAGQLLTVSHLARGRNSTLYPNPHEWDPSRKSDVSFCFGGGVHACPGKSFALDSMTTIVTAVRRSLGTLGKCSGLRFDRPSLADREFAFANKM